MQNHTVALFQIDRTWDSWLMLEMLSTTLINEELKTDVAVNSTENQTYLGFKDE